MSVPLSRGVPVDGASRDAVLRPPVAQGAAHDDASLVPRIRAGDQGAFQVLFRRYYDALCTFAERYVPPMDAEEIVEQVFATIWARRTEWKVRHGVAEYLFGAVRHGVTRQHRHERVVGRLTHVQDLGQRVPGLGASPAGADEQLLAAELSTTARDAIRRLPPKCRTVFLLRCQEGRSYAEIATALRISVRTVENHIADALKALRRSLKGYLGDG
jgi:RNA polymerase sigma-70 factor, ECF subfamily